MASYEIIAWREIPAVVEARDGARSATRQFSGRFQALIDSVAMHLGLQDSDAYLAEWTRSAAVERAGTAEAGAGELEHRFPEFIGSAFGRP